MPHARGGTDEPDNLQALCFSCNAAKRDRDATDFRGVRKAYDRREPRRPFCEIPYGLMMSETDLAYAVRDGERAHVAYRFSEPAFHDLFLAPADVFALRSVLGLDKVAEGIASDLEIETLSITSRLKG